MVLTPTPILNITMNILKSIKIQISTLCMLQFGAGIVVSHIYPFLTVIREVTDNQYQN